MTQAVADDRRPPTTSAASPGAPAVAGAALAGLVAVVTWCLAVLRGWGDTGVTADGALATSPPWPVLTVLGAGVVLTFAGAGVLVRGRRVAAPVVTLAVLALGVVGLLLVGSATDLQDFPADGGLWGRATAWALLVAGVLLVVGVLATVGAPATGRRWRRAAAGVPAVVGAAALVAVVVVTLGATGSWSERGVTGRHPAAFSEDPGPVTVSRVGWQSTADHGTVAAVLGGRVVTAQDVGSGGVCRVVVRGLDAGAGQEIWSSSRRVRCDGPRLASVDGDNQVVRVTLRGTPDGGAPATGPPVSYFLDLENGRPLAPGSAASDVVAWTEGFGIVVTDDAVRGVVPGTGATAWTRPLPRCTDGSAATVGTPAGVAPGSTGARSPYDDARPAGAVAVTQTGDTVVLGWTCGTSRHAWLVATTGGVAADRTVDLPTTSATTPTTFTAGLTMLVAAVPAGGGDTALVVIDLGAGTVRWQRPAAPLTTVGQLPATGEVAVSSGPDVTTYGVDGAVRGARRLPSAVVAAVELVGNRVVVTADGAVLVTDPVTGATRSSFTVPGCPVRADGPQVPLLAGPGGLVLRCTGSAGPVHLVGLVT